MHYLVITLSQLAEGVEDVHAEGGGESVGFAEVVGGVQIIG